MRVALLLEYRGTTYHGFQLQPGLPTIQGELESALEELTGETARVTGAGRTDAGVHALGQVVSFATARPLPPAAFMDGLKRYLPSDIGVRAARPVSDTFDARRDALRREYMYCVLVRKTPSPLLTDRTYWLRGPLDVEVMGRAAGSLPGRRNFKAFSGPLGRRHPVRTMFRAEVTRKRSMIFFRFEADSFLPQQVRRMVGALLEVGRGRLSIDAWGGLAAGSASSCLGMAPACGLYLRKVTYGIDLFSEVDEDVFAQGF